MKNVHILPTENYSPLVHSTSRYGGFFKSEHYSPMKEMGDSYQHIYITSNEEIKEGDWILNETHNIEKAISHYNYKSLSSDCKKIILTTDQDLIKDGVQAIDDEFLEWFVKNQTCEGVETLKFADSVSTYVYKIIIPKEEPKQETLEKAAERLIFKTIGGNYGIMSFDENDQVDGYYNTYEEAYLTLKLKWQQRRSYSEEEVENILIEYVKTNPTKPYRVVQWFEQFKKK